MTKRKLCLFIVGFSFLLSCSPASRKSGEYRIALVPARSGQHGIFLANADTTGGKLVTSDSTAQLRTSSWSPDGKKILFFAARHEDSQILTRYRMPMHLPLYWMDASGANRNRLLDFPVSRFEWAPDSRQLLVVSAYEDPAHDDADVLSGKKSPMSAAYLVNLQSGEKKRVTGFGQNCYGSFSPDGTRLALSFGNEQSTEIYAVSLDGRYSKRVDASQANNIKPKWSPDSGRIAYISISSQSEGGASAAYVVNADGTNTKRAGTAIAQEVSWSPDGKALLIQTPGSLLLSFIDENREVILTSGTIEPHDAVFAPDGKEVIFRSPHEGDWHLYAVDPKTLKVRKITGQLTASMFCLSPLQYR
jgi:Tol biopolymer transport system component